MRMPNSRQISEEQQDVYEDAPIDGTVLVTGPPGTGKTVIAFLRANAVARKKSKAVVLMYNRVLRRYTENVAKQMDGDISSKTFNSWLREWWQSLRIPQTNDEVQETTQTEIVYYDVPFEEKEDFKLLGGKWNAARNQWYVELSAYSANSEALKRWEEIDFLSIDCSYSDRELVKSAGARWDKETRKWLVSRKTFNENPAKFAKWRCEKEEKDKGALKKTSYLPPELKQWLYDWDTMIDQFLEIDEKQKKDWGYLIIDEAQDFSPEMFRFLRLAARDLPEGGITILADENQRLQEGQNSSIAEISNALKIKEENKFHLTKNFRNTRQIADLASFFFVGLDTGKPLPPTRVGNVPKLLKMPNATAQAIEISKQLKYRGALEVGVIVDSEDDRRFFTEKLSESLPAYLVQSYTSKSPKDSDTLVFDDSRQGVITILNRRSCKGLEFDIVFIPCLENFKFDDSNLDVFKMNMYVMCSRARTELILMISENDACDISVLDHLPPKDAGILKYQ